MTLMSRGDGGAMEEQNEWIPQTYFEDRVQKSSEINFFWKQDPILSGNYYEKGLDQAN